MYIHIVQALFSHTQFTQLLRSNTIYKKHFMEGNKFHWSQLSSAFQNQTELFCYPIQYNLFKWTLWNSSYSSLGRTQIKVQKRLLFSQSNLGTTHHYAHWHYFKRVHNMKNNEQIITPFSEMLLPRLPKNPQKSTQCQDVCPVAKCEHCVSKIFIKRAVTLQCLLLNSGNKTALVKFQFHPTILGKIIFASFRLWWNHPCVWDDLGKISCTWLLTAFSFCWSQRNWTGLRLHSGCRLLVLWLGGVLPQSASSDQKRWVQRYPQKWK